MINKQNKLRNIAMILKQTNSSNHTHGNNKMIYSLRLEQIANELDIVRYTKNSDGAKLESNFPDKDSLTYPISKYSWYLYMTQHPEILNNKTKAQYLLDNALVLSLKYEETGTTITLTSRQTASRTQCLFSIINFMMGTYDTIPDDSQVIKPQLLQLISSIINYSLSQQTGMKPIVTLKNQEIDDLNKLKKQIKSITKHSDKPLSTN